MRPDRGEDRLDKLFASARGAELYDENKEYGFEARVLARIREAGSENRSFRFWAWRLMPFFASLLACLAIWMTLSERSYGSDLIPGADTGNDDSVIVTYLAGE